MRIELPDPAMRASRHAGQSAPPLIGLRALESTPMETRLIAGVLLAACISAGSILWRLIGA